VFRRDDCNPPKGIKSSSSMPFVPRRGPSLDPPSFVPPPASGTYPLELPDSVISVAGSIARCRHPDVSRFEAKARFEGFVARITWCAFCGAMAADEGEGQRWQPSAASLLLSQSPFAALAELLQTVHESGALPSSVAARVSGELDLLHGVLAHLRASMDPP
jgi:hypothetical protein